MFYWRVKDGRRLGGGFLTEFGEVNDDINGQYELRNITNMQKTLSWPTSHSMRV